MILPPMILPTVSTVQPKKWQNHKWQNHGGRDGAARRYGLWFWLRRFVVYVANGFTLLIQRARQALKFATGLPGMTPKERIAFLRWFSF